MKIWERIIKSIQFTGVFCALFTVITCIQKIAYGEIDQLVTWLCVVGLYFITDRIVNTSKSDETNPKD